MQLIYRAQTIAYIPTAYRFISPAAVNWRFQLGGEVVKPLPRSPLPHSESRRHQLAL